MLGIKFILMLSFLSILLNIQCSSDKVDNSICATEAVGQFPNPVEISKEMSNRIMCGFWNIILDVSDHKVTTIQDREMMRHYNVTSMIPAPEIIINSYDPSSCVVDVSVTLSNPYPINCYDARLIIFTDNIGHCLLNADEWTFLYDIPGGLPANPFKAFSVDKPTRIFNGNSSDTRNLLIKLPGGNPIVQFAVDVSYPGHCEEPYSVENFRHDTLFDTPGSRAEMSVKVFDWQNDVTKVRLYCPSIVGTSPVDFIFYGVNDWRNLIYNNMGAMDGTYVGWIVAYSANSGPLPLIDKVDITVDHLSSGWARTWGNETSSSNEEFGWADACDLSCNVFTTGSFRGKVDFDTGPALDEHTSNGNSDIFLNKFNRDGGYMWARTWGGQGTDEGYDVTVDSNGNVYVLGAFKGTVDFDPGPDVDERTSISEDYYDNFLSKFDNDGNHQWVLTWEADYDQFQGFGFGATVDHFNNVYVTSCFRETSDLDPGSGVDEHTSNGHVDIYVSKFSDDGSFIWARTWGGGYWDEPMDITSSDSNDVYITGRFSELVDFDPGPGIDNHESIGGGTDIYLSKLDQNGDFQWAKTWGIGGLSRESGWGVTTDSIGCVLVTGSFTGIVDFDPGPGVDEHEAASNQIYDIFLSKFKSDGAYQWAITWFGPGTSSDYGFSVETDNLDNIILTGSFSGSIDFDPGPLTDIHNAHGLDTFICKLNNFGDFLWARTWGGGWQYGQDVAVDRCGDILAFGSYYGTVDMDPGPDEDIHTASGLSDIYLVKYLPNGYWN